MGQIGILLGARLRALVNVLRSPGRGSVIRVTVVTFIGAIMWFGLFGGFFAAIRFADRALNDPVDLQDLTALLLGLFFMSLMMMLTFSNAVVSFGSLYRSPETQFLMGQPVGQGTLYGYKMIESLSFSSWASMVLGLPLLLAYGLGVGCERFFYLAIPLAMIPVVVIPAAAGAIIAMLLTYLFPRNRLKALAVMAVPVLAVGGVAAIRVVYMRRGSIAFATIWSQKVLGQFKFVRDPMLPSQWASSGLVAAGRGEVSEFFYYFALLSATAFFLVMLGQFLAVRLYNRSWDAARSNVRRLAYPKRRWTDKVVARLVSAFGQWPVFIHKDLRTFVRDPSQWSQAVIFFGLLGVYIANIRNLNYDLESPLYRNLIATLNMLAVSLTLSTMTTRFVFPLISLEGRCFWVLGLLPVPRWRILAAKFAFASVGAVVVTEVLVILSNWMLSTPREVMLVQALLGAGLAVGLSGIAVGMGAIFPDFNARTPSEVVSSFGGTLTLVASLALVLAMVIPEAVIRHRYDVSHFISAREFRTMMTWMLSAAGAGSVLCVAVPMALGARALNRQEF